MLDRIKSSLTIKTLLVLVGIIIISIALLAAGMQLRLSGEVREDVLERNEDVVRSIRHNIDNFLADQANIITGAAGRQEVIEENIEEMFDHFDYELAQNPDLLHLYLGTEAGEMHVRPDIELPEGFDPRERPWYENALGLEEGEVAWTDPYIDEGTGDLVTSVATPVYDGGEFTGVVAADLSLDYLSQVVSEHEIGETGYSFIVENNGETMAHPDRTVVEDRFNVEQLFNINFLGTGETGYVEYEYQGERAIATYMPLEEIDATIFTRISEAEAFAVLNIMRQTMIGGAVLTIILMSVVIVLYTRRFILQPINSLTEIINRLADFDLRYDEDHAANKYLEKNDEIGDITKSIATMQNNLVENVEKETVIAENLASSSQELSANSEEMSASAQEISTAIQEVASGAEEQTAQIDETESRMNELIKQISAVADIAEKMGEQAEKVNQQVEDGNSAMEESIQDVGQVKADAREVAENVNALGELSGEIGEIVDMIDNIAEQTNLLALNASIEAARAGEAGQGFNVVANEIRELAEETSKSTQEIGGLIQQVQGNVDSTVDKMDNTRQNVDKAVNSIEGTASTFNEIENSINELAGLIEDVVANAEEMKANSNEVSAAIEEVAAVSEESSSNAEQVAAASEQQSASTQEVVEASEELAEMAQELADITEDFRL